MPLTGACEMGMEMEMELEVGRSGLGLVGLCGIGVRGERGES